MLCSTNPPFSMDYSVIVPKEKEVLADYTLATYGGKRAQSLRSSVMFLERYWNLLKPGGRLLTVIDDSVLLAERTIRACGTSFGNTLSFAPLSACRVMPFRDPGPERRSLHIVPCQEARRG